MASTTRTRSQPGPMPAGGSGLRVLTIFVRAGTDTYADAEAHLDALFARQLPGIQRETLVVDNLLPPGEHSREPGRVLIGGDNSAWEFSAVDAAVAHLGPAIWQYDLINIVTSAFEQLYVAYLERFRPEVLSAIVGEAACLGHIDCYNAAVRIGPYRSQHWLRSCFLFLPVVELKRLGSLVSARHREPWFGREPEDAFGPGSPLDATYQHYITEWLLGKDIGQGVSWHRTLTMDGDGLEMFVQKARAIVNEHLLAIRLRAMGCRLIDVTWLSAVLARGGRPDFDRPWWAQLTGRDRDTVSVVPEV